MIDLAHFTATTVNAVENQLPTPVTNSSMTAVGNKCFVFGGTDLKGTYCPTAATTLLPLWSSLALILTPSPSDLYLVSGVCYNDIRALDVGYYLSSTDITVGEGATSEYSFKILIIGDAG